MILPISTIYNIGLFLVMLFIFVLWTGYQRRVHNQIQQDNKQLKIESYLLKCRLLQL